MGRTGCGSPKQQTAKKTSPTSHASSKPTPFSNRKFPRKFSQNWYKHGKSARRLVSAGTARPSARPQSNRGRRLRMGLFAAQQGAEKAVKAVFQKIGAEAWGHSVTVLLEALPNSSAFEPDLLDAAKELDKHYIPARYPNSHPQGAPFEYYTRGEARRAVSNADKIIAFCSGLLFEPPQDDPAASAGDGDVEESASRD